VRLPRFDYLGPNNLEGALDLLATHRDDAKILAGGTDLLVRMKKGLLKPKIIISLKALNELSYIKEEDNVIKIGAGPSAETSYKTIDATTTTSRISTGPDVSPVTRMEAKPVMHGKIQTGATPPASQTAPQHSWPWGLTSRWQGRVVTELWILQTFIPRMASCPSPWIPMNF